MIHSRVYFNLNLYFLLKNHYFHQAQLITIIHHLAQLIINFDLIPEIPPLTNFLNYFDHEAINNILNSTFLLKDLRFLLQLLKHIPFMGFSKNNMPFFMQIYK
jgi:uncharacterized protein Usg